MASMINYERVSRVEPLREQPLEISDGRKAAMSCFLDELPGLAFGVITVAYLLTSMSPLIW